MKTLVYLLITALTYPLWWTTCKLLDGMFYIHKKLTKWIEK